MDNGCCIYLRALKNSFLVLKKVASVSCREVRGNPGVSTARFMLLSLTALWLQPGQQSSLLKILIGSKRDSTQRERCSFKIDAL